MADLSGMGESGRHLLSKNSQSSVSADEFQPISPAKEMLRQSSPKPIQSTVIPQPTTDDKRKALRQLSDETFLHLRPRHDKPSNARTTVVEVPSPPPSNTLPLSHSVKHSLLHSRSSGLAISRVPPLNAVCTVHTARREMSRAILPLLHIDKRRKPMSPLLWKKSFHMIWTKSTKKKGSSLCRIP